MSTLITCIIVDDEQLAIDTLSWQLAEFCVGVKVEATFTNPNEAYQYLQSRMVDLCFLDIDMPEMTGFEFLQLWDVLPPFDVIFSTAYSEYAIQAFKVSALDYLLKPIDEEDLVATITKYRSTKQQRAINNKQLTLFLQKLQSPQTFADRIALPTTEGVHMVDTSSIIRLQADNNYTSVIIARRSPILVSKTLKEIENLLDPNHFFRIHQSHTIDISKVKLYQRGRGGSVTLSDGTVLPVSKNKKEEFMRRLGL